MSNDTREDERKKGGETHSLHRKIRIKINKIGCSPKICPFFDAPSEMCFTFFFFIENSVIKHGFDTRQIQTHTNCNLIFEDVGKQQISTEYNYLVEEKKSREKTIKIINTDWRAALTSQSNGWDNMDNQNINQFEPDWNCVVYVRYSQPCLCRNLLCKFCSIVLWRTLQMPTNGVWWIWRENSHNAIAN